MVVEELTAEQIRAAATIRDEWIAIGLATGPADRPRAEGAVRAMYAAAHLDPPSEIIWGRSPREGAKTAIALRQKEGQGQGPARMLTKVVAGPSLRRAADWRVEWHLVAGLVMDLVARPVGDRVWGGVGAAVHAQVWPQFWDWSDAEHVGWFILHGQHDVEQLAFHDYFVRVLGLECSAQLQSVMDVARSVGWWWPFERTAILTERPVRLERDEQGRLHCASGPAIEYSDGWGVYAWHGIRVPRRVIETPETLTASEVLAEGNLERRRVMIERMGADRLLRSTRWLKVRHTDQDQQGHVRRLLELRLQGDEGLVMIEVRNSTPEPNGSWKSYMLRVPPDVRTCAEAVAWTFGMKSGEYAPAVET